MGKYHLPDGETLITDLQCLVVYTPNDPVYRQALWGAISQLTKFWMWEPDGSGGEHDAADSWDLAYAATLESFGMLEQLLESVDEVEPLLRELLERDFCCDNLPGSDNVIAETEADAETSTTDVDGGVFPDGIANESEWDTYICNAATALIDRLIEAPGYITQFTSWSISLITAVALWYTGGAFIAIAGRILGVLTILDIFDLLDVFENLVAGIDLGTEDEPSAVESELLAIREELICDILTANDASGAASAVNNRIGNTSISNVWKNLFLLFFTNEHFMAAIFNNLAEEAPDSTCPDCTPTEQTFFGVRVEWDTINYSGSGTRAMRYMGFGSKFETDDVNYITAGSTAPWQTAHGPQNALDQVTADTEILQAERDPVDVTNHRITLRCFDAGQAEFVFRVTHVWIDGAWEVVAALDLDAANTDFNNVTIEGNKVTIPDQAISGDPDVIVTPLLI